jgi:hypothetical protein
MNAKTIGLEVCIPGLSVLPCTMENHLAGGKRGPGEKDK